jgi:hypothetical protein
MGEKMGDQATHLGNSVTMPARARQALQARRGERQRQILAETKERLRRRNMRRQLDKSQNTTINIYVSLGIAERAKLGCMQSEGVDLLSYLRATIGAFADMVPATAMRPTRQKGVNLDNPDNRDWYEMIKEVVENEIPEGGDITVAEIWTLALGMLEEVHRDRGSLILIGKIMRTLRWRRIQVLRGGKRVWGYRKPAG